jgi:sulfite reductase beta subunit-like hemoprotein
MTSNSSDSNGTPALPAIEQLKIDSNGLYGPIVDELQNDKTMFEEDTTKLLKHHGTYQQDNRDVRAERRKAKMEKDYTMMVRTKAPGGVMTPEQYILCDDLADKYGQHDLRITSRQGFQFHGVLKGNLRNLIHDLNHLQKITTLGACGDVVRNVMACPVADIAVEYKDCADELLSFAAQASNHFLPKSKAYYELWLDDERVRVEEDGTVVFTKDTHGEKSFEEPLYKKQYLPRKFKIGIATDFDNSIDVYTQDIGVIAETKDGKVVAYEILAGGGLGHSHSKPETYARLGTPVANVPKEDLLKAMQAIVEVQRDHGNRQVRHQARLKYTVDRLGVEEFTRLVHQYAGKTLGAPKGVKPRAQPDYLGWHRQAQDGLWYVGVWVENGRVKDFPGSYEFRSGLRRIVESFKPSVRLTPHHNIILANIREEEKAAVQALLDQHKIPTDKGINPIRRLEMACPALPLCGLALAEAERSFPALIEGIEKLGHGTNEIVIRMTGCPNSCARPETAEIGIIGRGPNKYNLYAGGDRLGTRMNRLVAENVTTETLPSRIASMIAAWKGSRSNGQTFGDWSHSKSDEELASLVAQS